MAYRPDLAGVLARYRAFYAGRGCRVLVHVGAPLGITVAGPVLGDYAFPEGYLDYLRAHLDAFEQSSLARLEQGLDDDSVPSVTTSLYGIALHSAFAAGEPIFGESTSWSHPVLTDWRQLDGLTVDPTNRWFRLLADTARYLASRARGKYAVCPHNSYGPMDLANALRGNELFVDLYDRPAQVHRLLDWCTGAIITLEEALRAIGGNPYGGLSTWAAWVPGNAVFLSEDAVNLCRPETCRDFALPYTQRLLDHFGGGMIHTHALGLHCLPALGALRGLRLLQVSDDPNRPRPVTCLDRLLAACPGVPLMLACTPDELRELAQEPPPGRLLLSTRAQTVEEGRELIALARAWGGGLD